MPLPGAGTGTAVLAGATIISTGGCLLCNRQLLALCEARCHLWTLNYTIAVGKTVILHLMACKLRQAFHKAKLPREGHRAWTAPFPSNVLFLSKMFETRKFGTEE